MTTELASPVTASYGGLVLTPRPFAREEEVSLHALPDGLSVAEMIVHLEGDGALDPALRPWVRVTIGDRRVERSIWSDVRPAAGDTVFVDVQPMGKSNPVRTILQIAVVVATAFVSQQLGTIPGAAFSALGMSLVNAIAPIKQPEMAQREQRYSLSGGSNAATPHEAIPIVMGRRRLYPPRCANWYTRTVANVVYLRMMFQPCVGWVDHADPRIGQTSLDSYDGVTARWRTRPDEDIEPIWFGATTPMEDSEVVPVTLDAGWVTRTAPMAADTLSIDIAFMAGLYETKESSGNPKNRSVTFEFRYGPRGGDPAAATACPFTVGGYLTFTRDDMDAYREGHDWAVDFDEYDIHIRRVTGAPPNNRITDELTWVCLRAFRNEPAVRDLAGRPWIEIEIKATEQLNGVPNDFNFIATTMVHQATADGPGGAWIATRNPADLYLAVSSAPYSDIELDDDERNHAAIAAWRAVCVAQGWTCDLAEASEVSVAELLQRIAATGRARPSLDFGALSVVVDWEKPAPRQMFTARNVSGFQGELVYPTEVHGLRLRFQNQSSDYDDDLIIAWGEHPDGGYYDETTATLYESLDIRDKTDPDQVSWEGARILAERKLRPETFTFDQDFEYVAVAEGDRAWLAHHVALVGQIAGRVNARVVDVDDATRVGVRLDELVVMEAGRSYDLAWRSKADAPLVTLALETVAGQGDVVWFATPALADDDQPEPGDLVTVFEHAIELLDVIIDRIKPKEGLKATLTCVPYAPELQTLGFGDPIPDYRTGATRPPGLSGAVVVKRTDRAIDQVVTGIGNAVTEAGKGVEEVRGGLADVVADLGIMDAALEAAQADATAALNALFDPASGALHEISLLQDQDALFSSDIAVLDSDLTTAVGRIDLAEARQRSLPNLIRNGNGSDPQSLHYWTAPSGGFSVAVGLQLGSYFAAAANSSGVTRYLYSDVYPTVPGNTFSLSLSGNPAANTGAARAFVFFKWCRDGAPLGDSATVVLDATTIDYLDNRAKLENVTVPAIVAGQVPNGYQVAYAAPNTHAGSTFSRIMVNYGAVAVPFNDQATAGDTLARVRQTEIAQTATDIAVAALDSRVGVSMQQGRSINANAYFGSYTASTGAPDGWLIWAGSAGDFTRQVGRGANYAVRSSPPAATDRGLLQVLDLTTGTYLLRFEGALGAGDWRGAGLYLGGTGGTFLLSAWTDVDDAGATGAGAVGSRSWSKAITVTTPGTYSIVAMHGWGGFGTASVAKQLDIRVASLEPVDAAARQALADATTALIAYSTLNTSFAAYQITVSTTYATQSALTSGLSTTLSSANSYAAGAVATYGGYVSATYGALPATVATQGTAISNLQGRTATWLTKVAAAGADPAYAYMGSDSSAPGGVDSYIGLVAKVLGLYNISSGTLIKVMEAIAGRAHFLNPLYIEAAPNRLILGPAFGASSNLLMWYGPDSYDDTTASDGNATFALTTDVGLLAPTVKTVPVYAYDATTHFGNGSPNIVFTQPVDVPYDCVIEVSVTIAMAFTSGDKNHYVELHIDGNLASPQLGGARSTNAYCITGQRSVDASLTPIDVELLFYGQDSTARVAQANYSIKVIQR